MWKDKSVIFKLKKFFILINQSNEMSSFAVKFKDKLFRETRKTFSERESIAIAF